MKDLSVALLFFVHLWGSRFEIVRLSEAGLSRPLADFLPSSQMLLVESKDELLKFLSLPSTFFGFCYTAHCWGKPYRLALSAAPIHVRGFRFSPSMFPLFVSPRQSLPLNHPQIRQTSYSC